uniref:MHD1 domain-containing protein n=1 Tax=Ananas comosus var. bracteatus TaxID=296719 RepID=A0A6V7QMH6_ANACO|nr:unnamed protein product [Ananas comosus var. bracteatus]
MGRRPSVSSVSLSTDTEPDYRDVMLECPFGHLETLSRTELRETAYELFFMSCRSSPGFGGNGRSGALNYYPSENASGGNGGGDGSATGGGPKGGTGMMLVNSKIKKALGLKARRSSRLMRSMSQSGPTAGLGSPSSPGKVKRPMTSAEIMRQQMRVTDQSDGRLRKTLMRTLVGQVGRRAETIILPLELLRQLKPSEFNDTQEYHQWQRRQLKVLEAGLISHPLIPLDRLNSAALRFREVIRASELKPMDTSKNSDAMRNLCNSVLSLAWRSCNGGSPTDACHWADGYPLNIHLYLALLQSVFDHREETVILDEVDELVELMRKTWPCLGINRMIHNACFAWALFQQYVVTGQVETDLICSTLAMLAEVASDAKKADREGCYVKVLSSVLTAMQAWAERKLLDYHESFDKSSAANMDKVLSVALSTTKIIAEDLSGMGSGVGFIDREASGMVNSSNNRVDFYIRSSMRNAFTKILENGIGHADSMVAEVYEDPSNILTELAKDTEQLALLEKETYSPVLKRWHPVPTALAVVTLHNCFGVVLKQYVAKITSLTNELVRVLQSAGRLEKALVQMVVEDSAECEDGGKGIVREMAPYEVDSIVVSLLKSWIDERLRIGKECLKRAKETESWIPRSKNEPYAQSAVDLMKLAKVTVDEFFEIPVGARDEMVQDLADGLESIFQEYTSFVASCGTKHSYLPTLPPLTRCNQDSRFGRLWKRAATPCRAGDGAIHGIVGGRSGSSSSSAVDGHHPRPSTSRGTQRLYIRLNTLHYLLAHLLSLDKSLSFFSSSSSSHIPPPSPPPAPSPPTVASPPPPAASTLPAPPFSPPSSTSPRSPRTASSSLTRAAPSTTLSTSATSPTPASALACASSSRTSLSLSPSLSTAHSRWP